MDLEKAISSFGSKDLDSKTVSILLSSLEKYGNNGDKYSNVKCVSTYLMKILEYDSNSSSWEHLSEDIGKICEACFCISVKLADKELIEHNISLLEKIIEVNQNLTNYICRYLLDPCLTALLLYNSPSDYHLLLRLANLTSSLCQKTSRMKRNEIVPTVIHSLNRVSNLVISCGDYEIQAAILEIIARCNASIVPSSVLQGSNQMLNLFSCLKKFGVEFKKYSFVNFEPDCRLFLNALNESLGDERQVYSIPCKCVVFNNAILKKPSDPNYKSFWVDLNLGSKKISFYDEPLENNWTIKCVPFDEVMKVISKNTICISKTSNKNVDSVKTEFSVNCKSDGLPKIQLLKIYSCKRLFKLHHTVLISLFPDIYECEVEIDPKPEYHFLNQPMEELISSPQFKGFPDSNEPQKFLSPQKPPSKSDTVLFTPTEIDINHNPSDFTVSSDKLSKNNSEMFCSSNSKNHEGIISNIKLSLKVGDDDSKNTSSLFKTKCDRKRLNKVRSELRNYSVEINDDTSPKDKKSRFDRTSCESVMNEYLKKPTDSCLKTNDSAVKRKRLYSIQNDNASEMFIFSSSQEEKQSHDKIINKIPSNEKNVNFLSTAKNVTCRKKFDSKKKPFRLFSTRQSCEESDKCIDSISLNQVKSSDLSTKKQYRIPESSVLATQFAQDIFAGEDDYSPVNSKKNLPKTYSAYSKIKERRASFSKLPLLSPGTSDSDYKPTSYKENVFKVENKKMLRKRNKLANTRDSVEKTKSNKRKVPNENGYDKEEYNKIPTPPKMPKKSETCLKTKKSQTKTSTILHNVSSSKTKNNEIFLSKKEPKKGGLGFINTIDLCKPIEPIRSDIHFNGFNDIEVNAVRPETYDFLPRKITLEPECQIQGQGFDSTDAGLCVDSNTADDMISRDKSDFKSTSLDKENHTQNEEGEISVQIYSDMLVQGVTFMETSFKVEDTLELSQKSVLNLQNNFEASLIQSQEERQKNLNNYDLQLQTSRNYILESCEKLQSNCREMDNIKAKLDETLKEQQNLIHKIRNEMAILEKAKEEFFKKESEVKQSESFIIIKLFKDVGNFVRRLITSFNQNALTNSN